MPPQVIEREKLGVLGKIGQGGQAMRGFVGCLVIICAAALVACSGSSQSGTSARSTTPLPTLGVELPGSQIPWDQVGPGWILSTWSQAPDASDDPSKGPVTLYLFDPAGGRYAITSFSPWPASGPGVPGQTPVLADWSGDGRHALFDGLQAAGGRTTMTEVNLTTGAKQTVKVSTQGYSARGKYSRPTGQAILLSDSVSSNGGYTNVLERVDLSGTKQLTLPTDQLGAAGKFKGDYLQTSDGSQLVLGTDHGMVVVSNGGMVVRQLPMPAPASSCSPVRWWTSTVILATCVTPQSVDMGMRLWQVPLAGGAPTALTPVDGHEIGYLNAWQVPSGTFLENVPGCGGDGLLFLLTPDIQIKQVTVPGVDRDKTVRVVGVTADKLLLKTSGGCGSPTKVLRIYDPAANTAIVLSGPSGSGGVKSAILYPTS
jgi:TolB protein